MWTNKKLAIVLGLILLPSPGVTDSQGEPKLLVRQYRAILMTPVNDVDEIRLAAEDLLASCSVDCSSDWGSEEVWEASAKGRNVLLQYHEPTLLTSTRDEEIRATEVLLPLPRAGWEFILVRTDRGIRCFTASNPQELAAFVCHESVRVYRWEAYAPYCSDALDN